MTLDPLMTRWKIGVMDLINAAQGHLAGGDWDKEMAEALGEIKDAEKAIKAEKERLVNEIKSMPLTVSQSHQG